MAMMNAGQQRLWRTAFHALGLGLLFCLAAPAESSTIFTFVTAPTATSQRKSVAARAASEVSSTHVHLVLMNLMNDPTSVGQALSFLFFQVDSSAARGTSSSSYAMGREVNSNGANRDLGILATGWKLLGSGKQMELCDISCGAAGPENSLIGAPDPNGKYSATPSIMGNGSPNSFLVGNGVFDLPVTGATRQSKTRK
jgi:hypothetical protein